MFGAGHFTSGSLASPGLGSTGHRYYLTPPNVRSPVSVSFLGKEMPNRSASKPPLPTMVLSGLGRIFGVAGSTKACLSTTSPSTLSKNSTP